MAINLYMSSPDCIEREMIDVLVKYKLTVQQSMEMLETVKESILHGTHVEGFPRPVVFHGDYSNDNLDNFG